MKNLLFASLLLFISVSAFAQTAFEKAMTDKIIKLDAVKTTEELTALSNDFQRIADKEKTQWLPYYYAALAQIQKGRVLMQQGKTAELDAVAEAAKKPLDKAMELSPDNAENYILVKMIHSLKMMVNPMERYMSEGKLATEALTTAEKLDPENPRISLLKAEDTYFTPEQFGGSKAKGLELFQKALGQYDVYKIKSALDPNWGKEEAEYFVKNKP